MWNAGEGSPEGVVPADVGAIYLRLDGGPGTTLYLKESGESWTGWVAVTSGADVAAIAARLTTAESDIGALETADTALDGRLSTAETDITALEAADVTLDSRLDAIEANYWVTTARIGDGQVTLAKHANMASDRLVGRDTASSGVPEELTVGGGLEFTGSGGIQRSALTGDVTASAGSGATTIANDAVTTAKILNNNVTLAKLGQLTAPQFLGRTTAGTGNVEALSTSQAALMLPIVTTSARGMVSTAPNDVRQVFRGNITWGVPKQTWIASFGCDTVTAGNTDRFLNPAGYATTPAGVTGFFYTIPFTGNLVRTQVLMSTVHTTNTFTVTPQLAGVEQTTQVVSLAANVGTADTTHATPLAVTAGQALACRVDHNGATNVRFITVNFFIEES